jgi:formate dehydrogenase major subunit
VKLRHTIANRVAGFVRDWSLPRQFAGGDPTREAAQSTMSRQLRPRLEEVDTIGTHTLAIGSLGGATLDNEEKYLIKKLFGAGLGMVWIESQARV